MFDAEGRAVDADILDSRPVGAARAIERVVERNRLAARRDRPRRRRGRLGVGDVLRDDSQPRRLGLEAGAGDLSELAGDQSWPSLQRRHHHLMEDFLDRVGRIGVAADVAELDHFGFEVDRVAVERRVRLVAVVRLRRIESFRSARCGRRGRRHGDLGLGQDGRKIEIFGLEARRIGVGDVGRNQRLARVSATACAAKRADRDRPPTPRDPFVE